LPTLIGKVELGYTQFVQKTGQNWTVSANFGDSYSFSFQQPILLLCSTSKQNNFSQFYFILSIMNAIDVYINPLPHSVASWQNKF